MNSDDAVGVNNQSEDQSNNQSNDQSESAKDGAASEDAIVRTATKLLVGVFAAADVDDSHGSLHAQQVLRNLDAALQTADHFLTPERRLACRLAALLHDADDAKYFKRAPATDGDGSDAAFPNAAAVAGAAGASASIVADALRMISWVSCSKNANRVPAEAEAEPELLWPRWADRLEAVGEVGVARCYLYALHTGGALSCATTPRPKTAEEALAFASPERFAAYDGTSASMLDHYYDKLLAIARPPPELVRNRFLEGAAHASAAPLLQVCLAFGETGQVPVDYILSLAAKHGLAAPPPN